MTVGVKRITAVKHLINEIEYITFTIYSVLADEKNISIIYILLFIIKIHKKKFTSGKFPCMAILYFSTVPICNVFRNIYALETSDMKYMYCTYRACQIILHWHTYNQNKTYSFRCKNQFASPTYGNDK